MPLPRAPTVSFRTFGCKTNQYDTQRMRQLLEAGGMQRAERGAGDLCVVNSCTVTHRADRAARRFIRRTKRESPETRIVVAGCGAALSPEPYDKMREVSSVVGGHDPKEVFHASVRALGTRARGLAQLGGARSLDRGHIESMAAKVLLRRSGATRGWLKIQDGCDRKCAFCATRLARGPSRSRSFGRILLEARTLAASHPELVITGVHIGHYGRDLEPKRSLSELVARLLEETPKTRFRLGSIEATEVDDDLIRLLETSGERLARHLHMPLQSGADAVLRRMRRWHTREQYRARAREIAQRARPIGLGADIIAGFPGETDDDHEQTMRLVREIPFTYLHVFPYSARSGTVAAEMEGRVSPRKARARSRELRELARRKGIRYARARGGARVRVVLEGNEGSALTSDYLRVEVQSRRRPDPGRLHAGTLSQDGLRVRLDET